MELPQLRKVQRGRSFNLVAATNGNAYSVRVHGKWKHHTPSVVPTYQYPDNYVPFHLKGVRRELRNWIGEHWPDFKLSTKTLLKEPPDGGINQSI